MTRERYLAVVLDEIEMYPATQATLIVSVDRRMSVLDVEECISLAIKMKNRGRRVVGIDVCGDPRSGDMQSFTQHLSRAKSAGLGLTVHIAEVCNVRSEAGACDSTMMFGFVVNKEYNRGFSSTP
jgi:adenosine deaminase